VTALRERGFFESGREEAKTRLGADAESLGAKIPELGGSDAGKVWISKRQNVKRQKISGRKLRKL